MTSVLEHGTSSQPDEVAAAAVVVSDLDLYYGSFLAVSGVSLTVRPRSVTALIGPSGCGKSTFVRSLNRLHELVPGARVEGSVEIDGQDVYAPGVDPAEVRRHVGMVFQSPNPFPTMTVYENVLAGVRLNRRRIPKEELDAIAERSLRAAHLWDELGGRLHDSASRLSGGQQQRLCIARAIAVEPAVLLMDEPASALDPIATTAIEDLIHDLKRRYTIVIVTHNMQQAARVSDHTGFFNLEGPGKPGRLVELDRTEKIFTNPADPTTEAYVSGRFG